MTTEFFYGKHNIRNWSQEIPQVTIYFGGNIVLSPVAMHKFNLREGMYFLLGYDKAKKVVTLRPCMEKGVGSRKLCLGGQIAGWSFLKHFEIEWRGVGRRLKRYELAQVEKDLVFSLNN